MRSRTTRRRHHLFARRCVVCGYDGDLLDQGPAGVCAACGVSLVERPARSYAEMEGLLTGSGVAARQRRFIPGGRRVDPHASHLIERWIAFLFFVCLLIVAIAGLTMAALATGA